MATVISDQKDEKDTVMATKKQGCSCEKCRECCTREPGWFLPDEVGQAAAYLKLRSEEFVLRYCEEHVEGGVMVISPARKPGKTECVFFGSDGLCRIHEVKPHECRKVYGCQGPGRHRRIREIILKHWK